MISAEPSCTSHLFSHIHIFNFLNIFNTFNTFQLNLLSEMLQILFDYRAERSKTTERWCAVPLCTSHILSSTRSRFLALTTSCSSILIPRAGSSTYFCVKNASNCILFGITRSFSYLLYVVGQWHQISLIYQFFLSLWNVRYTRYRKYTQAVNRYLEIP